MIYKINNRNNNSNSSNNKITYSILKENENHFCKDISANNAYNLANQIITNNKKENKDKGMRMILPIQNNLILATSM